MGVIYLGNSPSVRLRYSDYGVVTVLFPQAHLLAAFCLRKLGPSNYPASLQHLNAALKLNPKMGEAYESRGVLYVKMGMKEDAQEDLTTLKQINPKLTPGLEAAIKTGKDVDTY